jgi:hypothetical protein
MAKQEITFTTKGEGNINYRGELLPFTATATSEDGNPLPLDGFVYRALREVIPDESELADSSHDGKYFVARFEGPIDIEIRIRVCDKDENRRYKYRTGNYEPLAIKILNSFEPAQRTVSLREVWEDDQ